jgi:hypothetical protein
MALLTVLSHELRRRDLQIEISVSHIHALGKLLLVFVVFWAYIAFCQYFLIWIADIPEEVRWFYVRSRGAWGAAGILLIAGHFVIPFMLLLSRRFKRSSRALASLGVLLLVMHYLDLYWVIMPALHPERPHPSVYDVAAFIGIGGFCIAAASWWIHGRSLVPAGDPRLERSLSFFTS